MSSTLEDAPILSKQGFVSTWVWSDERGSDEVMDALLPPEFDRTLARCSASHEPIHCYFLLSEVEHSASFYKDVLLPLLEGEAFQGSGGDYFDGPSLKKYSGCIAVLDSSCAAPPGPWCGDTALTFLGSYAYDRGAGRIGANLISKEDSVAIWLDLDDAAYEAERLLGWWDTDYMECGGNGQAKPIGDLLRLHSRADYSERAVEAARALGIETAKRTLLLFDYECDAAPGHFGHGTFLGNYASSPLKR
jgi:hypothetical protein